MGKNKSERRLMPGVKPGLISGEHRERMGPAIWAFLHFLTIPMMDGDDGVLQTPQGQRFSRLDLVLQIQERLETSRATAYNFFNRLVNEGYLFQHSDGTWEIAKYENFRIFLRQKKREREEPSQSKNLDGESKNLDGESKKLDKVSLKTPYKNKKKKVVTPSQKKEEITTLQARGMAMLRERCKSRGDILTKGVTSYDAKNLKEMLESGYTLQQIFACYDGKLDRLDVQGKHVPLEWVKRDIAFFVAARGPTTEEELEAIPDLMEDEDE